MLKLSQRANLLKPSATLAMAAKARQMKAAGLNVISFATGEPDFDTPPAIREAAKHAIDEGRTRYVSSSGIPELKSVICEKLRRDNGLNYADDEIVVTCGAKQAIYGALQVMIDPGDEVIVPAPYWVSYPEQVVLAGGTPIIVKADEANAFRLMPAQLEKAITKKTRAIILNYPSNPTGSTYSRAELAALGKICADHSIAIISDEIYEKIIYTNSAHVSIASAEPAARAATILVNGVSKAYAMTGWRMGYAAGPQEVVSKISALIEQDNSCIPDFVQRACIVALLNQESEALRMRDEFKKRRDLALEKLLSIPGMRCHVPDGTFYLLPNVRAYLGRTIGGKHIVDATALSEHLLDSAHIATVSGDPFGAPGHIRLSYATSRENIEEGMKRLSAALVKIG